MFYPKPCMLIYNSVYFRAKICVTKFSKEQNLEDNYVPILIHAFIWEVHIRSVLMGIHKALTPQASLSNHGNFPLWLWQRQDVNISFCWEGLSRLKQESEVSHKGPWRLQQYRLDIFHWWKDYDLWALPFLFFGITSGAPTGQCTLLGGMGERELSRAFRLRCGKYLEKSSFAMISGFSRW